MASSVGNGCGRPLVLCCIRVSMGWGTSFGSDLWHALNLCLSCCYVTPRVTPFAQTHPPEGKTIFSETNEKDKSSLCFVAEKTGEHTSRLTLELYFQPHIFRQVLFHRWGKKKKAQELRLSLERLDTVVKDMIVPLEF